MQNGEQDGGFQLTVPFGWYFLAWIVLSIGFVFFVGVLTDALGVPENFGIVVVAFGPVGVMTGALPNSLKQFGLIVALAAVGGILAVLSCLATVILFPGLWGLLLGAGLGGGLGVGFVLLSFKYLGIERWKPSSRGQSPAEPRADVYPSWPPQFDDYPAWGEPPPWVRR